MFGNSHGALSALLLLHLREADAGDVPLQSELSGHLTFPVAVAGLAVPADHTPGQAHGPPTCHPILCLGISCCLLNPHRTVLKCQTFRISRGNAQALR